jgi:hypothetical protein
VWQRRRRGRERDRGELLGVPGSAGSSGDGGGLLDVSPTVQAALCGTGVGVIGAGVGIIGFRDHGEVLQLVVERGNSGGGSNGGSAAEAAITPAAAGGNLLDAGTLPFTGGNTLITAIAGLALAGIGTALLRVRGLGYKG